MKYTNFHMISPKETREKWARVFFVSMFVTRYNFETATRACVSEAHWLVCSKLDAVLVDISVPFIARDFRADFLKLAPSRDFETSSRAVKTRVSTSRQTKSGTPPLLPPLQSIWPVLGPGGDNESDAITFMFFKYQNNIRQSPDQKILLGS